MKTDVYGIDGQVKKQAELPNVFHEAVRPDIINRAFLSLHSAKIQPQGPHKYAGLQTSAGYVGRRRAYRTMINISHARLPRVKLPEGGRGEVRKVPQARQGRAAHPLKPAKIWAEKINRKEKRKAIRSAIAATAIAELVQKRGHLFSKNVPIIIEDAFEKIIKTKDARMALEKIMPEDLQRADRKTIKAGRGKMRGRKYRQKKTALVVVSKETPVLKAVRNIPGMDVSIVKNLNAELLAPGGVAGRLTIYTESALAEIDRVWGSQ